MFHNSHTIRICIFRNSTQSDQNSKALHNGKKGLSQIAKHCPIRRNQLKIKPYWIKQRRQLADPGRPWEPAPLAPKIFQNHAVFRQFYRENPLFWANFGLRPSWGQNSTRPHWPKSWIRAWRLYSEVHVRNSEQTNLWIWVTHLVGCRGNMIPLILSPLSTLSLPGASRTCMLNTHTRGSCLIRYTLNPNSPRIRKYHGECVPVFPVLTLCLIRNMPIQIIFFLWCYFLWEVYTCVCR